MLIKNETEQKHIKYFINILIIFATIFLGVAAGLSWLCYFIFETLD